MTVLISCNICRRIADEDNPHALWTEFIACAGRGPRCVIFLYETCVCGHLLRRHQMGQHLGCYEPECKCTAPELPE